MQHEDFKVNTPLIRTTYNRETGSVTTTDVGATNLSRRAIVWDSGYVGPRIRGANHNYSYQIANISFNADWFEGTRRPNYIKTDSYWTGGLLGPDGSFRFDKTPNVNEVYSKALTKLNGKTRGEIDLMVDFAQAGQTYKMLKANQVVQDLAMNFVNHGKVGAVVKTASALWLMTQLGIRPLVGSIYGSATRALDTFKQDIVSYSGYHSVTTQAVPVVVTSAMGDVSCEPISYKTSVRFEIRMRAPLNDISTSALNPVSLAWELLPLSFVADYFYDLGGLLRNVETSVYYNSSFVDGFYTILERADGPLSKTQIVEAPGIVGYLRYFGDVKYINKKRSYLTSYPFPRKPSFRLDLGGNQLLTTSALLGVTYGAEGDKDSITHMRAKRLWKQGKREFAKWEAAYKGRRRGTD